MRNTEYETDIFDTVMPNTECEAGKDDKNVMDKKPEMTDIINTGILNMKYEASIQEGETNMFKEAETGMLKTNPKGKNNAAIPIEEPNTEQW
jgi:hypothetical protein